MIASDGLGKCSLQYEVTGRIRRIMLPKSGVTKRGMPWSMGGMLMEVSESESEGSARLFLVTFDEYLIEQMELIGVGKDVRVMFHIDVKERYDNYSVSCILDSIGGITEGESFLYGQGKGKEER